jgi:hypothetical protein
MNLTPLKCDVGHTLTWNFLPYFVVRFKKGSKKIYHDNEDNK